MSNEINTNPEVAETPKVEAHPKPAPQYEVIEPNENNRLAVVRKVMSTDFKLDDLLNFITEATSDKEKAEAMVKYNESIIENIKGFHPEVIEFYESLVNEKKTAFLLFAKAVADREKKAFEAKAYTQEIEKYNAEIAEIEQVTGLKSN